MQKSAPQPRSRKTPRGGRMMAKMILMMSLRGGRKTRVSLVLWSTDPSGSGDVRADGRCGRAYLAVNGMVTTRG